MWKQTVSHFGQDNIVNETYTQKTDAVTSESDKS